MNPLPCDFPHGLRIDQTATDPEQLKEFAVGWNLDPIQIEAGRYLGRIRGAHIRSVQLGLSEHSLGTRIGGSAPAGTVVLALRLPSPCPTAFRGRRLEAHEMAVIHTGEEIDSLHAGASQILTVALQQSLADAFAHRRDCDSFQSLFPHERLVSRSPRGFAATGRRLLRLLDEIPMHGPAFADAAAGQCFERRLIATLFAEVQFHRVGPPDTQPRHCAKQAESYLRRHPRQALDLPPLCRQLEITPRALQLSFHKTFGLSMKSYAQAQRFNGARRELLASHPAIDSVKAVAMGWGFRHLGRFAADYLRWFGECPSATLAE